MCTHIYVCTVVYYMYVHRYSVNLQTFRVYTHTYAYRCLSQPYKVHIGVYIGIVVEVYMGIHIQANISATYKHVCGCVYKISY